MCFSLIRNSERIMDTKSVPETVCSFDGIRVLSQAWVILGHVFAPMMLKDIESTSKLKKNTDLEKPLNSGSGPKNSFNCIFFGKSFSHVLRWS